MGKRTKIQPLIVADLRQAEGTLAEIAALDRKLGAIEGDLNATIDTARERAKAESEPLLKRRKELCDAMGTFATLNRAELFKERKSLDLGFGTIGFRRSSQIVQINKINKFMTLEKLHEFGFTEGIRTKQEVNKEALENWPEERLQLVGLRRQIRDVFFIEINIEEITLQ